MAYKKKAETKERVESVFDVKGELTFWVKLVVTENFTLPPP